MKTAMKATIALVILLAAAGIAPRADAAQAPHARLSAARTRGGEVIVSVKGTVRACGITATNDAPTFAAHDRIIEVTQATAGVACMNPPPATRPYRRSVNVGKLPPGPYTIHWSFPQLTLHYVVRSK